jgi:uncharacterized protein (DUF169 family)
MSNLKSNLKSLEEQFARRLSLKRRPVAVILLQEEPQQIKKFTGTEPSGCSFWRLAAEGKTFYTVPSDHYNCPVGSYTHNIDLPAERAQELNGVLGMMFGARYIKPEEIPGIPRLPQTPKAIAYAPVGDSPLQPDVVLFACRASAAMLLNEAAQHAGANAQVPTLGRPTCMAIPVAFTKGATAELGCIGNRTYTGIAEDEMYVAIPGPKLEAVSEALDTILSANAAVGEYAKGRREQLATE